MPCWARSTGMWFRNHSPDIVSPDGHSAASFSNPNAAHAGAFPNPLHNVRDRIAVTMVRVRASEAERLSEFSSKCFDQTYGPLCRAADVDAHIAQYLSASAWLKVLTDGTSWVFAAMIDGEWAAYTHLQLAALPADTDSVLPTAPGVTPMEICRLYVSPRWQGQGVAATLLANVFTHAMAHGAESVWLSSWQENARANAFYKKWEFRAGGHSNIHHGRRHAAGLRAATRAGAARFTR